MKKNGWRFSVEMFVRDLKRQWAQLRAPSWIRRHLAVKLILLIFIIAVVPFVAVLVYSHISEERLYNEHFFKEHHERMNEITARVGAHFAQLHRELSFLSGSVLMHDMPLNDSDRRIASLLERYKAIYDIDINLLAISVSGRVIASTRRSSQLGGPYKHFSLFEKGVGRLNPVMTRDGLLLLQAPLYAGQKRTRVVGYIVMEYPVSDLNRFSMRGRPVATVFVNPDIRASIGHTEPPSELCRSRNFIETDEALWLCRPLTKQLPDWFLGYRIDRMEQRSAMQGLNRFLMLMLFFGVGAIAAAAYWFARRIVEPLDVLQRRASEMVRTRRYDEPVKTDSEDEIGRLAASFNVLAEDIRGAFDALNRENLFRLQRLTQMIGLFNRLMQTEEESVCLKTALEQLKTIAPEYNVRFTRLGTEQKMPTLYIHDFDHNTTKYYGSLILPEGLDEGEQAFFRAIASMIAARIEQIRAYRSVHRDAEAKTAFISHMSHDLRTPLHAILSQAQHMIGYGRLEEDALERVGGIENAAQNLLGMINDLLDLARLDSGKCEPELETLASTEVVEIVDEVAALLSPLAEQKNLALEVSPVIPDGAVMTDRRFLRQIVLNLVSNAIKFTDSGGITCRLEKTDTTLCLVVTDTGRGMMPETLLRVFEPFVQSESEDRARGSGLGLALSRRYAQLFGGDLVLLSGGAGAGSTARLCFTTL
jgi:signal transduction histidine kinase